MGNQTQTVSRFGQAHQWLILAQTTRKQLIQNKLTREIVERHHLSGIQADHVKQDHLIYEWRRDAKAVRLIVEVFEVRQSGQEEEMSCISSCHTPGGLSDLVVYTENIFKLYEMNAKIVLREGEQLGIFKDLVEGVEMLALKFGQFLPSKDAVGYNAGKRGKVWIHENFCCNTVQSKRTVRSKQQRPQWQKEVIETLVDICRLCSTEKNYKNCKFYAALELVRINRLYSFAALKEFKGPQRKAPEEKEVKESPREIQNKTIKDVPLYNRNSKEVQNFSKEVELANSQHIVSSNQFISTEDIGQDRRIRVEVANKTFAVPAVRRQEEDRVKFQPYRSTYEQPKARLTPKAGQVYKPNYVEIRKKQFNSFGNNGSLVSGASPRRQQAPKIAVREKPAHYAILEELYDSRSSRSESKMVRKENIQLVDSWVVVENRHQGDNLGYRHNKNMVLEESIILKAGKR